MPTAETLDDAVNRTSKRIWRHLNRGWNSWASEIVAAGGEQRNIEICIASTCISYAAMLLMRKNDWDRASFLEFCEQFCGNVYDGLSKETERLGEPEAEDLPDPMAANSQADWIKSMSAIAGFDPEGVDTSQETLALLERFGAELTPLVERYCVDPDIGAKISTILLGVSAAIAADLMKGRAPEKASDAFSGAARAVIEACQKLGPIYERAN